MSTNNQKIITTSYIDILLDRLYKWMPFKRKNGGVIQNDTNSITNSDEISLGQYNETDSNTILSIGIGDILERKNALKITKNGEIYIITNLTNGKIESLQQTLDKKGVEICHSYEDMLPYLSEDYMGKCLLLIQDDIYNNETYKTGLYIVSLNTGQGDKIKLFKIGDSLETVLADYYTKSQVDELIKKISLGDISDLYYSKSEIDNMLTNIDIRLSDVEEFISEPILVTDLEIITQQDLNNDGNIEK